MKYVKAIGIDLAKNIFQLHGVDGRGKKVLSKRLTRSQLIEFMVQQPACEVGLEACMGAHYWSRKFEDMGHKVKMMSPQFVKPYVKSNKNDRNDAAGIAEAMSRPDMKFVPIKSIEQQDIQLIHRARELLVKQRVALGNQIRGLLAEYGVILPQGVSHVKHKLTGILEDAENELTAKAREIFNRLHKQFNELEKEIVVYDKDIEHITRTDERCQRLLEIEGIGPVTASAVIAAVGDAKEFKRGRELAAWLGLVPKQHSSGNKIRLQGISKRGDRYLRTLLIHGARSVVNVSGTKTDPKSLWVMDKKVRGGHNKAAVALANKNARIIWAVLAKNEPYRKSGMAA
jgi:transposase